MAELELEQTSRARMIPSPGREELPRQSLEIHPVDMTRPTQSALGKSGVKRLEAKA